MMIGGRNFGGGFGFIEKAVHTCSQSRHVGIGCAPIYLHYAWRLSASKWHL